MLAVYPGSFDPITNGHMDIIRRAAALFDQLIVAVLENPTKKPLFTVEERKWMIKESIKDIPNVQVDSFHGLTVEYARQKGAGVLVRGLRAISDFEFEFQLAAMNHKLHPEVEAVFMMTNTKYSFLSSSAIKEAASFGGCIRDLVPPIVEEQLKKKFSELGRANK
ncbi:MAG TPA: pantetheine-phosphate adenylyltransferase [Bacillota bacterium]|mgnify:CR=1 FL=1|jgi:pantetheine-phosphate adenylyltransferase|nr:pantetheine-phosphate adenylyltransferase [Bacillota bacterium]HQD39400.1 pantetheine-phosphate adenylyltransferase [Bacillota bacterium]